MKLNSSKGVFSDINITPLVDVMLVLLVIFMVTTPMLVKGIKVNLPKTHSGSTNITKKDLIVSVDDQGRIYLNKQQTDLDGLKKAFENNHGNEVIIEADKAIEYGLVVKIIDIAKQSGIEKVGLATTNKSNKT
ncbi:Biopolymer transport protein ExbD/TolR [Desulfurella amilsii]|uniref:Biopolymer transport protein ExbD/TolR n=1 Tax=Desulfurella amilsii TaxID=1562698 RepID=A0A1X4XV81_9BACT|nr:biopolymer transporter ExbD [Desulfurella amilsii]OSS41447.1 Biopolymer transport protein ExbD/TolR [Desulfurella amilsii]